MQVLAAVHRHVPSPAQRSIHSLRSLLLIAKLASLVYLGGVSERPLLRLFWSLLYPDQEEGCEAGEQGSKEEEEEVTRLELMKVHMLLPMVRHGLKTLGNALSVGSEPIIYSSRTAAVHCIGHWSYAFSNEQLLAKTAFARELYQAGRPLPRNAYVLLQQVAQPSHPYHPPLLAVPSASSKLPLTCSLLRLVLYPLASDPASAHLYPPRLLALLEAHNAFPRDTREPPHPPAPRPFP